MPTRRELLKGGLCAALCSGLSVSLARTERPERILVVVQLSGGNDSLNTVLPLEQDLWYRLRPTLSGVAQKAHRLAPGLGLHPELAGLAARFEKGHVAIAHGVGYPQPDRSHFRSLEIWHTGRVPGDPRGPRDVEAREGWIGRAGRELEQRAGGSPAALFVGAGRPELSFCSRGNPPAAIADRESLGLSTRIPADLLASLDAERPNTSAVDTLLRSGARAARILGERLEQAANADLAADWPSGAFAQRLSLVARGIRGGLPTSLYGVTLDGFDTHLRQAQPHARLLAELDRGLAAFLEELERAGLEERVLVMVFSEFGRRAEENGTGGTDHGAAGAVLLAGRGLAAREFGPRPDLERLVDGDVPHGIDLRALYDGLRRDFLSLPPEHGPEPLRLLA